MTFKNDRHILYVGWVWGIANKITPVVPVLDEDGNYTDRLLLHLGPVEVEVIIPPPPDDWILE